MAAAALLTAVAMGTCAAPSDNGVGGTGEVDTTFSDIAVGGIAGAGANADQTTGVGVLTPRSPWNWSDRIAGLVEIERVANAASYSCNVQGMETISGSMVVYAPATDCTVTYPTTGVSGPYNVTGSWTLTFSGAGAVPLKGGAVSNNPQNTVVIRAATSGSVVQSYTGPFGDAYVVTESTATGTCLPWNTVGVSCGGYQTICISASGCPHGTNTSAGRSVSILGAQITGTKNGITQYDHTVLTTSDILITGYGANRTITGGTVVVYHNLAHIVTTTTINGPLTHEAGCAYPISGSITTAISGGADNGLTETVTFGGECGVATVVSPGGKKSTLDLHLVL